MTHSKLVHRSARTLVAVVTIFVVTALLGVSGASAHYSDVSARVDCDGVVSYTATAWPNRSAAARTNPNISVWVARDGGSFTQLPHEDQHRFDAANGFSFTDSIHLSQPLPGSVEVRVMAAANWGDGAEPGGSRRSGVLTIDDCPTTTTTSPATTTTVGPTTTTTVPSSTTTAPPSTSTTTTSAPATTTTGPVATTAPGAAVTTTVAGASETTMQPTPAVAVQGIQQAPTTVAASATPGGASLPLTGGGGSGPLVAIGLVLLGGGTALLVRRRASSGG